MIIYIEPKSLFPDLTSDTIYGAIFSAISNLYENFDEVLDLFKKTPPFLISSAFPFIWNKEKVHFFPMTIENLPANINTNEREGIKKLKNVNYIHESIFNKMINGTIDNAFLLKNINDYKIKDGLIYPKEIDLDFNIESHDNARNSINRVKQSTDIFYSSGNYYRNAGLFFLVRFINEEYRKKYGEFISGAIKFLSDRGIGGDISSGKGHFKIIEFSDKAIIQEPKKGNRFVSMSRYHPAQDEIIEYKDKRNLCYNILTKRGRSSDGSIRNQVRFFKEGSTFPDLGKEIYGNSIHVGKEAIEIGYAFNIKISGETLEWRKN